jgi:DNA repair photolyase
MGELNKRLDSFDRLTHTHEKFVHEISSINDALAELSTQIRFRPIIPALNQEEPQDINEALDVEIEELLEGFQDLQSLSLPQER